MTEPPRLVQFELDFAEAVAAQPLPPRPDTSLRSRYRVALRMVRGLETDAQRLDLIGAVVWPTDTRLREGDE